MKIPHLPILFFLWTAGFLTPAWAQDYSVPFQGSPYRDLAELQENQILHLPTGITVTFEQMMDTVSSSRVIYVGETHDNLEAHRIQLEVLRSLHQRFGDRLTLGMEMFRRSAQEDLDRWHRGEMDDRSFRKLFRKNWGRGYGLYQPIFEYLKKHSIPLIGLKASPETEQKLREGGPGQAGLPEMDTTDEYHRAYSMSLFGGNETHTGVVSKPYQMLLLWEESMAETVADFVQDEAHPDRKLMVLAGGFHVQYGYGIPKRAFRRTPHDYSIILPAVTEIPEELKGRQMKMEKKVAIPLYAADFSWKVAYIVPPPNRIRLGVYLEELEQGLRVLKVDPQSNAERMHLQPGDVLLKLDGQALIDIEDLASKLQTHQFGDTVSVTLRRGDEEQEVSGTLQEPVKKE